jgi:hypothetical protein
MVAAATLEDLLINDCRPPNARAQRDEYIVLGQFFFPKIVFPQSGRVGIIFQKKGMSGKAGRQFGYDADTVDFWDGRDFDERGTVARNETRHSYARALHVWLLQ